MVVSVRVNHVNGLLSIMRLRGQVDALGDGEGGEPNPVADCEDDLRIPWLGAHVDVELPAAMPHTVCYGLAVSKYL